MLPPVDLLMIRHGLPVRRETTDGSPADPELDAAGQDQAQRLARWLEPEGIDAVYVSPMRRALETAAPLAAALGVEPRLVHVTSDAIAAADPEWGAGLLGDKAHSMVFDNTKVKRLVPDFVATTPFEQGAREIVAWHDADPSRQRVDEQLDAVMDRLAAAVPG